MVKSKYFTVLDPSPYLADQIELLNRFFKTWDLKHVCVVHHKAFANCGEHDHIFLEFDHPFDVDVIKHLIWDIDRRFIVYDYELTPELFCKYVYFGKHEEKFSMNDDPAYWSELYDKVWDKWFKKTTDFSNVRLFGNSIFDGVDMP